MTAQARCPACPVAPGVPCIGQAGGRWCGLAAAVPAYREVIAARSEGRDPAPPPDVARVTSPPPPSRPADPAWERLEAAFARPPRLTREDRADLAEIAAECNHAARRPNCRKVDCRRFRQTVGLETCILCVALDRDGPP